MKVSIHTMYFLPDSGSAPILMNELASYLASRGHRVEVVTTIPRERGREYKGRLYSSEFNNGFQVKRFWTNATPHPIGRLIAWNIYTLWTLFHMLNFRQGDILFLRLPPLQLGFMGFLAKRVKAAKILLNVQDIHPDLSIESGILKNSLGIKLAKKFEKWVYQNSETIIVISEGFKKNLLEKGVSPEKLQVIPNWVDTDFLRPLPKENFLARKYSLAGKFVIMYSGTISISSNLAMEKILEAANLLKKENDILFAIVGDGIKKENLQEKRDRLGLHNVVFLPFQPYKDLPYLLASSDILLVPLDKEKSHLSVPSKLYNFMAAGRPILGLADSDSEVASVIKETKCGVCIEPKEARKIAETIADLKNSKYSLEAIGLNGRRYAVENFRKERVLKIYEDLISSMS
jgi:colanic acid biosynthesis glycosyl transferase WcaI